jgi:hypothetical protein
MSQNTNASSDDRQSMRRGRPIKYPRPPECPHVDRPEHANGVCYQCSSNINNQKKREKKIEDGDVVPKVRTRRNGTNFEDNIHSAIVELNVGGKIFATTLHTLTKEVSLLSLLINGTQSNAQHDRAGRLFIDRDPTHFRWMLNYLRDGYIVTVPASMTHRLEILQEARYYSLHNLIPLVCDSNAELLQTFSASKWKRITNGQNGKSHGSVSPYNSYSLQALQFQSQSIKSLQSQQHYQAQLKKYQQQQQKKLQQFQQQPRPTINLGPSSNQQQQQQLYQYQQQLYQIALQNPNFSNILANYPQTLNETLQQYEPALKKNEN